MFKAKKRSPKASLTRLVAEIVAVAIARRVIHRVIQKF